MNKDDLQIACTVIIGIILLLFVITFPFVWFSGHAKSAYIKQTQGIDVPWYHATWLEVTVNDVGVKVKNEDTH